MYGTEAQGVFNGPGNVNANGYGWLAWNTGTFFAKDKLFPLVIQMAGGGSDGTNYPPIGPGGHIEFRQTDPLPADMIVVQIMLPYASDSVNSDDLPRVVEWALGPKGIPQVDPAHVAIWGASGGSATAAVYASEVGTSQGVTHCVLLSPIYLPYFASTLKIKMPTYMLATENDFSIERDLRTSMGLVLSNNPGVRLTLLNGFTKDTFPVGYETNVKQFLDEYTTWEGVFRFSHITVAMMGHANAFEIFSKIGRKTTPFANGGGLPDPTWDPTDPKLNQPFIDVYDWFLG